MISLSNVFKFTHYKDQAEKKVLEPKVFVPQQLDVPLDDDALMDIEADEVTHEQLRLAKEQAQQLIEQAKQEIAQLKANTNKEIADWKQAEQKSIEEERERIFQAAREQGYQEGYEAGFRTGSDEGVKQYHEQIEFAASLARQMETDWKRRIVLSEPYLIELTIEIAQKVIQRELLLDEHTIIEMVKETLKQSSELKEITLSVHPNDYNLIRQHMDDLKSLISSQANLIVLPDHSITVGGCIVRSSLGTLDARIDTQLEEIKKALLDVIEGSDADELEPVGEV